MYIRTKDGVYEVKVNKYHELVYCKNNQIVLCCNIINQSENLEELCDMFVYCKRGFYEIYRQLDFAHYDKGYIKNGGTIYGAICTSKGLIYVAKINENGELELI